MEPSSNVINFFCYYIILVFKLTSVHMDIENMGKFSLIFSVFSLEGAMKQEKRTSFENLFLLHCG